ncbi:MAG: shikimate dehydrogenase [Exiguobacterium sp.]|uniref:Shikimate dehydrogenase (NADP(+)) n=1 Tax=Exiguobacterium profundum TaxID=307643 RepID=A0ABY8AYZ1_9BACL|nr:MULTISPECIES: shikimate dehydrogenase [Exiguobacterium]MBQ6459034.1 shikimate dehydrogenase [Exiguobacterium sp.]WED54573.1 shikimate dehydrogenase [Exiguobacterium profundum]VXA92728.1 shikimate 5-dehydrogenase [Exiguobacterium sp. 8H]VXB89161.1 shikimate 5-dehydrogenase [Exiguobacterium sp. 8A]
MNLAVIGHPIAHSLSPQLHEQWLRASGLFGRYEAIDATPDQLPALFAAMREGDWDGFNVTIPYKEVVVRYLDDLDEAAKHAGAVNTVYKRDGRLIGTNTDGAGLVQALMPYTDFTGRVLIVGAGGAARGIVQALPTRDVTIVNRTVERAKALADTFGVVYTTFDEMDVSRYDVIIQTTSVGMDERSTPLSLEGLRQNTVVCDIIYRPLVTPMLQEAKRRGAKVVTGVAMFVGQGALSFEKWTGVKPDETVGKKLIEGLLEE